MKDNDSWRSASNPLLYNSGLGKKPAWYAVRSALRHHTLTASSVDGVKRDVKPEAVYDLQGRRISSTLLKPGLYIIGGKKVVIK